MRQSMNDSTNCPDIILLCQDWNLWAYPRIRSTSITCPFVQGRKAEVSKHEFRDDLIARKLAAKEYVFRLDVAMDDPPPASRRNIRIIREFVIAIVKEGNRVRKLDEALPQEILRRTSLESFWNERLQIAPLAMLKVQNQRAVRLVVIRVIEVDDARVRSQYVFENVHLARDRSLHVEAFLLLAHQNLPVAFPLDDPDFALAALADLSQLFIAFGDT